MLLVLVILYVFPAYILDLIEIVHQHVLVKKVIMKMNFIIVDLVWMVARFAKPFLLDVHNVKLTQIETKMFYIVIAKKAILKTLQQDFV